LTCQKPQFMIIKLVIKPILSSTNWEIVSEKRWLETGIINSIGTKIILPYFLLTLVVAVTGTFIITTLVTNTLQERFTNQLLDAGRVVAESMVRYEAERLQTVRAVVATIGVAESVAMADSNQLAALVPQLVINSDNDAVVLLDGQGQELYSWLQTGDAVAENSGFDFSQVPDVQLVLSGQVDDLGDKRVFLADTNHGQIIYTIGPVWHEEQLVGAALIGTFINPMLVDLTLNAVARVTLYDTEGRLLATTLSHPERAAATLQTSPEHYEQVRHALAQAPERHHVVTTTADTEVPLQSVEVLEQQYILAYGDWRLRGQSVGLFSVALPSNFIFTTAATSRNLFSLVFAFTIVGVFVVGLVIARSIITPLQRLVQTAVAVSQGNLQQHTGIQSKDEIGQLAQSFDMMTAKLAQRNRQLVEQASELQAILHSIADGVMVVDTQGEIVTSNPPAQQLLADMAQASSKGPLSELSQLTGSNGQAAVIEPDLHTEQAAPDLRRYQIGNRILSALAAPVRTPAGDQLGTVIVMRDITREVEAEQLKDAFVTSISHELRTPLTVIKACIGLLEQAAKPHLPESQHVYLDKIQRAGGQLEQHITQLINISELQAGTIRHQQQPLDLAELLQEVAAGWQPKMNSKGLDFQLRLPQQPLPILGDPDHLRWAVDNLLNNAYQYTPEGEQVTLEAGPQGPWACLSVNDTGPGIASADQPYLFDRFFRVEQERNFGVAGVGLGLYITRALVELHQGEVSVESKLGHGSHFEIKLPLAMVEVPA
jgi:two-component system, OmpR family, sensor histidine kinase VicK